MATETLRKDDIKWWQRMREAHENDDQIRKVRRIFHEFKDSYEDTNFTRPLLSTIQAKTLIIHGDRDAFFPIVIPVDMYTSIPESELWTVPGGGGLPRSPQQESARLSTA